MDSSLKMKISTAAVGVVVLMAIITLYFGSSDVSAVILPTAPSLTTTVSSNTGLQTNPPQSTTTQNAAGTTTRTTAPPAAITTTAHASIASGAGTVSDPLISLSYAETVLAQKIENSILARLGGNVGIPQTTAPQTQMQTASSDIAVVELRYGQRLIADGGGLVFTLRQGGTAVCVSSFADQGIGDLTDGSELLNNVNIPVNHNLLIPRSDGRGILITSERAWVVVMGGSYVIQ